MESKNNKELIVFVCNGNIHRSPIAEQVFKVILKEQRLNDKFQVISRGIMGSMGTKSPKHANITGYTKEWMASKATLEKYKINITKHQSRPVTYNIAQKASVIIVLDKIILTNKDNGLRNQFPQFKNKIHLLSELYGKKENISDCDGVEDSEFHKKVIEKIYTILKKHWRKVIMWTGENSIMGNH